ncbi:MAG TPA: hypothetical protein VNK24_07625 [Elusimicrobiota bacterium]|nr:hypothetical protein [Elusimicrobiota bacterium]
METYDFEKLSREIALSRAKESPDSAALAARAAREVIVIAVEGTRFRQEPRTTVKDVCRGVMSGLLISGKRLPDGAVAILRQMAEIADKVHIDPMDLMTWGMEGIASVVVAASREERSAVGGAISDAFMGAGEVFRALCDEAAAKKQKPG